jgi:hypothetical protein
VEYCHYILYSRYLNALGTSNYRNAPELPKCPSKLPKCPIEKRILVLFHIVTIVCGNIPNTQWPDPDNDPDHVHRYLISNTCSLIFNRHLYIYIYVWKLNQTVLELYFRAVKFLFFPRRNLNSHHWYTAAPFV